jgi:two-component system, sensor histidine kinase LadS
MIIKLGLRLFLILALLMIAPLARAAEPLLISEAYWVDESAKATFQEAVNAPFVTYEGSLTKGYKPFALWLKIRISGRDTPEQLALIVKPAFIRRIELYEPHIHTSKDFPEPLVSGRDAKITPNNHIGLDNGFVIPSSKEPRDVFLRITTTTTLTADINVQSLNDADYDTHVAAGTLSIYFAFLLAFLLWSLLNWAVRRDLMYGLFALRLLFSVFHLFVWFGFLRYFFSDTLSASVRDHIYNLVTVCLTAVCASFDFKLISDFGVPRWLRKAALSILGLSCVCLLLLLLGKPQFALYLNAIIASSVLVISVVLAFSANNKHGTPYGRMAIYTMRFGFSFMAVVVIVPILMFQNVLNMSVPWIKVLFLHALISTVILFAILSIRARQRDLLVQQTTIQYEIKERELRQESERRIEKERFLSMLTHELRNPLSVIRLMTSESSSSGKAVHKAALEMAQIIERVEQSEKLDDAVAQSQKTRVHLGPLLRDIAREHSVFSRLDLDASDNLTVETDETLLRSIVRNLLDNAGKYSPETSRMRLMLGARSFDGVDGAQLSILNEVGDAGTPDAEKLFTKYYRSKGAHRRPGSGLGLFLVASWARILGGNISYEQVEDASGTSFVSFSLWLPI